jgi:hypothetical protein
VIFLKIDALRQPFEGWIFIYKGVLRRNGPGRWYPPGSRKISGRYSNDRLDRIAYVKIL